MGAFHYVNHLKIYLDFEKTLYANFAAPLMRHAVHVAIGMSKAFG
nr:hypothetical protein [Candidatus Sigynarchaeota archaeon]